ncbi:Protein fam72a [Clydaea vesicula]|uniref:Protein fam72a n=1 Tax=Clydaea vesicula TaxID=447962 RepID=A0AAD5U379_9FUNG|nr:Protein fam72a [Clydaea vesicula]
MSSNDQSSSQLSRGSRQDSNHHSNRWSLHDVINMTSHREQQSSRYTPRTETNLTIRPAESETNISSASNYDSAYTYGFQSASSSLRSILETRRLMRSVERGTSASNLETTSSRNQSQSELVTEDAYSYTHPPSVSTGTSRPISQTPHLSSARTNSATSIIVPSQGSHTISSSSSFSEYQNARLNIQPAGIFERSFLTATSSQARPQFRSKAVCQLSCKYCGNGVCRRGMKAILLADMALFSTDMPPSGVSLVNEDYQTRKCFCRIRDVACLGCGNVIGYHPCQSCMDACNNGHFWMFHVDHVNSTERMNSSGTKTLLWANLTRADADVEKVDCYDEMCR